MKRLALAAIGLLAAFAVLACKDSPPTVRVFIECGTADSWTPAGEQEYDPGILIAYHLMPSSGGGLDFVVTSKGIREQDSARQQERYYNTCRVFMGVDARDASPNLPNSTHVIIECSDKPRTDFMNAHFEKAAEVEAPLDVNLRYEEIEEFKHLTVWLQAATASFFWETVDYWHCSASGPMIEELRD